MRRNGVCSFCDTRTWGFLELTLLSAALNLRAIEEVRFFWNFFFFSQVEEKLNLMCAARNEEEVTKLAQDCMTDIELVSQVATIYPAVSKDETLCSS